MWFVSFLLLTANPPAADELANFVAGLERSPLVIGGKPVARVEKEEGRVVRLQLDRMQLTADDFRLIGSIATLRRLSLIGTNVADKDLIHLRGLTGLEGVNLTNTEVTDKAIEELCRLPALRSCCLGNVLITPAAVGKLKAQFPELSLGYYRRAK